MIRLEISHFRIAAAVKRRFVLYCTILYLLPTYSVSSLALPLHSESGLARLPSNNVYLCYFKVVVYLPAE